MRITEILTESQLAQLDEGPIGSALGAVGRGIGKAVGGVAKGVGAVAGGVVGAGRALKKGYQTGKAIVGDDPDPNAGAPGYTAPAAAAAGGAPAAAGGAAAPAAAAGGAPAAGGAEPPPTAQDINAAGPKGTAAAKPQTGQAATALAKTDAVTDKQTATKAGETVYAQVKANIDKLDKQGKTRILNLLQKSIQQSPAKPAAKPAAGAGAFGQMAQQLAGGKPPNTMANAPVSASNTAKPGNPNLAQPAAAPAADAAATTPAPAGQGAFANVAQQLAKPAGRAQGGGKVAGALSQTPGAVKKRAARAAAKQPAAVTASLVHHGKSLNEVLAQRLEIHKRRMFESSLTNGTASVFVK